MNANLADETLTVELQDEEVLNVELTEEEIEETIVVELQEEERVDVELTDIYYMPGFIEAEEQRRTNELERIANEEERITYYEEIKEKIDNMDLDIPSKVSELENDANYQTQEQVNSAISSAIGDITGFSYTVVNELPSSGETGVIYLISKDGEQPDIYNEYIWLETGFEKIGTTEANLSDYYTKEESNSLYQEKGDYVDSDYVKQQIEEIGVGDTLPIGTMLPIGTTNTDHIPTNWLVCDGREVSRTAYEKLFNVIGTNYGEGDGSTTFNLPDKRGRVSAGLDETQEEFATLGKKGGSKYMQKHSHKIGNEGAWFYGGATTNLGGTGKWAYREYETKEAGEGNSGNLQPYEVDNWIIKALSGETEIPEETMATVTNEYSESVDKLYSCDFLNNSVIVESGSNEYGKWEKYANGKMIQWGTQELGTDNFTTDWWTYHNRSTNTWGCTFPQEFKTIEYAQVESYTSQTWFLAGSDLPTTTGTARGFLLTYKGSRTNVAIRMGFYAVGTWK